MSSRSPIRPCRARSASWSTPSACVSWSETRTASRSPNSGAPCSTAAMLPSTNCGRVVKDIEFLADPGVGEVRIGSTAPLAASFVSTVIDRLHRRYPRMVFHVAYCRLRFAATRADERNFDLLIVRKIGPLDEDRVSFRSRSTTTPISWQLARRTRGCAGATLSLLSLSMNYGFFRHWQEIGWSRLSGTSLAPQGTPLPPRVRGRPWPRNDDQSARNGPLSWRSTRSQCSRFPPSIRSSGNCR